MSFVMDYLVIPMMDLVRYCAGFHGKTISVDGFEWSYMERDAKTTTTIETVVFVHGFSSWKESWIHLAWYLDPKFHIIVPDLPGQGRTTPADPTLSYTAEIQAERLRQFLEHTLPHDRKIHLVGCSLGGMLAGLYAAKYPERVSSLILMCPAGMSMPKKSDAYQLLDEGLNLLLAKTPEEMNELLPFVTYAPMTVPRLILSIFANHRMDKMPVFEKIFNDFRNHPTVLEDQLHRIQAKSLILWGKNDRILDVSTLSILQQKLVNVPQKNIFVLDECGHTVQHEKAIECLKAMNMFLNGEEPCL